MTPNDLRRTMATWLRVSGDHHDSVGRAVYVAQLVLEIEATERAAVSQWWQQRTGGAA